MCARSRDKSRPRKKALKQVKMEKEKKRNQVQRQKDTFFFLFFFSFQSKTLCLFESQNLPSAAASPEMMFSSSFGINPRDNVLFFDENRKEKKEDNHPSPATAT